MKFVTDIFNHLIKTFYNLFENKNLQKIKFKPLTNTNGFSILNIETLNK